MHLQVVFCLGHRATTYAGTDISCKNKMAHAERCEIVGTQGILRILKHHLIFSFVFFFSSECFGLGLSW